MEARAPARRAPEFLIRPMWPAEEAEVRRIFRATLRQGHAAPPELGDLRRYEELSLGWYLRYGHVLVVVCDGRVGGYLLACLDENGHRAWQRRQALRWAATALLQVSLGQRRGAARHFVLLRLRDGWRSWRTGTHPPASAHAHVNLDPQLRTRQVGPRLARRMDTLVRDAGLHAWYGEMNLPAGRRLAVLERGGLRVAARQRSATFTWLAGAPIDRITLVREVPPGYLEHAA